MLASLAVVSEALMVVGVDYNGRRTCAIAFYDNPDTQREVLSWKGRRNSECYSGSLYLAFGSVILALIISLPGPCLCRKRLYRKNKACILYQALPRCPLGHSLYRLRRLSLHYYAISGYGGHPFWRYNSSYGLQLPIMIRSMEEVK